MFELTNLDQLNDVVQRSGLHDKRRRNEAIRQGLYDTGTFQQNFNKEIGDASQPKEPLTNSWGLDQASWDQGVDTYHQLFDRWNDFTSTVTYGHDAFEPFSDEYLRPGGAYQAPEPYKITEGSSADAGYTTTNLLTNNPLLPLMGLGGVEGWLRPQWKGAEEGGDPRAGQYAMETPWYQDYRKWYEGFGTNIGDRDMFDFLYEHPDMVGNALARSWSPTTYVESFAGGTQRAGQQLADLFKNYNISGSQAGADLAMRSSSEYAAMMDKDDDFLGGILNFAGPILSMIPGMQPFGYALSAMNAVANNDPLGLIMAGMGGLGGWDALGSSFSDAANFSAGNLVGPTMQGAGGFAGTMADIGSQLGNFSSLSGIPVNALKSGGLSAMMSAARGGDPLKSGMIEGLASMFGGQFGGGSASRAAQMAGSFGLNQLFNSKNQTPGDAAIRTMMSTMPVVGQASTPQQTEQQKKEQQQQLLALAQLYRR